MSLVLALSGACGSPSPAVTPGPSGQTSGESTTPTASAPEPLPADIAYAMHQREQFGLEADLAWVQAVAANPRARTWLLDFPMLPEEEKVLQARQADYDAVATAVKGYAEGIADQFGGVYIDQARHTVVALWTATPEAHRMGIFRRLGRIGPLEVRLVRHSERDLDDLLDRISSDWDWMRGIGAKPTGAGVEIIENLVSLQVSSANPAAPALILAHYGFPADMLRIESDGTGILLLPRGTIRGTVVTAAGKAPGPNPLMVSWAPDGQGPGRGDCGGGDIGYGVGDLGQFELPCAPGGWTITIEAPVPGADWTPVGSGHVIVPAGGEVSLRITLDPGVAINR